MENMIGFALCLAAAIVSRRRAMPVIICCYYAAYFFLASGYVESTIDAGIQVSSNVDALYSMYIALGSAVVASCVVCSFLHIGRPHALILYGMVTVIYMITDAMMLITPSSFAVTIHSLFQEFAVIIDVLFAWLGADNGLSSRAFGYIRARGYTH